jgi:prolyl-tRNA synthetase
MEGHTAHATKTEAIEESERMMNVYGFCRRFYVYPSCIKTETERFAGAEETYCIEALMQDGKRFKRERHISWAELCKSL